MKIQGRDLVWAACVVALFAWTAQANPEGKGGGKHSPRFERMRAELALSEEQAQAVQKVMEGERQREVRLRAQLRVLHNQMDKLLSEPTLDEAAVRAKAAEIRELMVESGQKHVDSRIAMRKVLTAEQARKFHEMREESGKRRGGRGRRGPAGDDASE